MKKRYNPRHLFHCECFEISQRVVDANETEDNNEYECTERQRSQCDERKNHHGIRPVALITNTYTSGGIL